MATRQQQDRFNECYESWLQIQEQDLQELLQATSQDERALRSVISKTLQHYQDYSEKRTLLAQEDAAPFFSPRWCTSLENSFLWIAGCRPSMSIRLIYSLCGSQLEAQLAEFLQGVRRGNLAELSAHQLSQINALQCKTVREEDKLSSRMASLQEDMADHPLVGMASRRGGSEEDGDRAIVDRAIEDRVGALSSILVDADKLRVGTVRELVDVLTPLQAVDLLIAAKQLHLSVHEWGKRRDGRRGRS